MILKITNHCRMGCNHCFHDCLPNNEHMTKETFEKALEKIKEIKPKVLLVSGGEPTDHPNYIEYIEKIKELGIVFYVLSNGMFIEEKPELIELATYQITNDERYYPKRIKWSGHRNIIHINELRKIEAIGRAKGRLDSTSIAPNCYNLRAIFRAKKGLKKTIQMLEGELSKFCSSLIDWNGEIKIGELGCCESIGSVYNTIPELEYKLYNSDIRGCNKCDKVKLLYKVHFDQLER